MFMKRNYSPDIGVQGGAPMAVQGYFTDINFLIAEDNGFSARILENILRALGARHIKRVVDGIEAVEALKTFPADICFIDWVMPRMNGIEFTNFIRNNEESPDVFLPIIMVTGLSEVENVMDARDAGVTEYLIKPCSVQQILSRVKSVVENPRSFVRKDDYFGPDRRRRRKDVEESEERRGVPKVAVPASEAKTDLNPESLKQDEVDGILGTSHEN
jgi:two-component system, chemotaxis family, chemotaxis protein CheY